MCVSYRGYTTRSCREPCCTYRWKLESVYCNTYRKQHFQQHFFYKAAHMSSKCNNLSQNLKAISPIEAGVEYLNVCFIKKSLSLVLKCRCADYISPGQAQSTELKTNF
ncbi:hypothetical protein ATANTOWER_021690 [Ataeniobius toweri]|uniref:Uncharacterized protein n=1 Tax=Ataeniobius toweri TaxID=208326 RepID=A0ABU7BAI5_9TELE|nr:hypothetical protein [Ataeniobius toweri]